MCEAKETSQISQINRDATRFGRGNDTKESIYKAEQPIHKMQAKVPSVQYVTMFSQCG